MKEQIFLKEKARELRKEILKMAFEGHGSHISSCLSIADILSVLYWDVLKINPKKPKDLKRDRFILSKGHATSALYAVLSQKGFFGKGLLSTYGKGQTLLGAHPENNLPGVEISTGSLGHGLAIGAGFALAAKLEKNSSKIFVLLSDAECQEGSLWESVLFAGHHHLDNICALIDYNKLQAFGRIKDILDIAPLIAKWKSFSWGVAEVDGHNLNQLVKVLSSVPFQKGKPSVVIANTVAGKGVTFIEDTLEWHYLNLTYEQYKKAISELDNL